eukprot:1289094-Pleurochrysis_carterae.AAC.1
MAALSPATAVVHRCTLPVASADTSSGEGSRNASAVIEAVCFRKRARGAGDPFSSMTHTCQGAGVVAQARTSKCMCTCMRVRCQRR